MKKKPYILPKSRAIAVSDPIGRWHAEEDERIHAELIEESIPEDSRKMTYKRGDLNRLTK